MAETPGDCVPPTPYSPTLWRGVLGAAFVVSLLLYNSNCSGRGSGDTVGAALVPFSIVYYGSLHLDSVIAATPDSLPYYLLRRDGHIYPAYPVAPGILATPLYLALKPVLDFRRLPPEDKFAVALRVEKLAASLIASLSVLAFMLLSRELLGLRAALVGGVVFALATPTWSISSQALWQHGPGVLLLILSVLTITWWLRTHAVRHAIAAAIFATLASAVRPLNALFALMILAVVGWRGGWRTAIAAGIPMTIGGAMVVSLNLWLTASAGGGYTTALASTTGFGFGTPLLAGLAGNLISPSRGLLVFVPILVLAIPGFVRAWRTETIHRDLLVIFTLFPAAILIVVSKWDVWWGGWSYGPRLLAEAIPFLVLLSLPVLHNAQGMRQRIIWTAIAYSIAVQSVGVYFYPRGAWHDTPVRVSADPGRLWDWRDNIILRSLSAGPGRPFRWEP